MNRTELVFILDMSGSMAHLTDDTVGGFNSILKEQSGKEGEVLVTTYLFNNDSRMIHDRMPIREVPPMTEKEYRAAARRCWTPSAGPSVTSSGFTAMPGRRTSPTIPSSSSRRTGWKTPATATAPTGSGR